MLPDGVAGAWARRYYRHPSLECFLAFEAALYNRLAPIRPGQRNAEPEGRVRHELDLASVPLRHDHADIPIGSRWTVRRFAPVARPSFVFVAPNSIGIVGHALSSSRARRPTAYWAHRDRARTKCVLPRLTAARQRHPHEIWLKRRDAQGRVVVTSQSEPARAGALRAHPRQ